MSKPILFAGFAVLSVMLSSCGYNALQAKKISAQEDTLIQTAVPGTTAIPVPKTVKTTYEPILADRRYLASVFTSVFGPTALSVDSSRNHLNATQNGSPCSVYGVHNKVNGSGYAVSDAVENCSRTTVNRTGAPVNPKPTVSRQADLAHACSDLTTNNTTLTYALKQISTEAVPEASRENVLKAFRLFYRYRPDPHEGLLESLQVMVPPQGATREHWRVLINTVCASSLWQVL